MSLDDPPAPLLLPAAFAGCSGVIDVRSRAAYARGHLPGSSWFAAAELGPRAAELPPYDAAAAGGPLAVVADAGSGAAAREFFGGRRWRVVAYVDLTAPWGGAGDGGPAAGVGASPEHACTVEMCEPGGGGGASVRALATLECGEGSRRLWHPSPTLRDCVGAVEAATLLHEDGRRRAVDLGCVRASARACMHGHLMCTVAAAGAVGMQYFSRLAGRGPSRRSTARCAMLARR